MSKNESENCETEVKNKLPKPLRSVRLFNGPKNSDLVFEGLGFKNETKALETLKLLEDRDIQFQWRMINAMYVRAKAVLSRTKDFEKQSSLNEAIKILQNWLDDYYSHGGYKEKVFGYLPLDLVEKYEQFAKYNEINDNGFLEIYRLVEGDVKKLRFEKVPNLDITWDVYRDRSIKKLIDKLNNEENGVLYEMREPFRNLPSKIHLKLIMFAYSPDANKIKRSVSLLNEKFQKK